MTLQNGIWFFNFPPSYRYIYWPAMTQPIVLVPADVRTIGAHPYHVAQLKYVEAVIRGAGCMPLILPAIGDDIDWDALLKITDGVMLTGSPSNVHPSYFGEAVLDPTLPLDPARDATTLPLITKIINQQIPLLSICRGTQEITVALGGTLHQAVHQVAGMMDHREDKTASLDIQYGPAHAINIHPNGKLARILDGQSSMIVNSVHGQGIAQLAPQLQIEATADDGLIEAYSLKDASSFTLALQWHPEWQVTQNDNSMKIFKAFGDACRAFKISKS